MNKTKIPYLTHTWNPVTGCSPVSAGCANCWARRQHERGLWGKQPFDQVQLHSDRLDQPLRVRKPSRIGVCFMGDLFHPQVPRVFAQQVFSVMARCQWHTFLVLTKRPDRMRLQVAELIEAASILKATLCGPLRNVCLGVSVEDQDTADERIPLLLQTPAALRFLSVEPMLGPVDLDSVYADGLHALGCGGSCDCAPRLDWVVAGGESGPKARPCALSWIRSIVEQCKAARVPCYVKQLGANPYEETGMDDIRYIRPRARSGADPNEWPEDLRVREEAL